VGQHVSPRSDSDLGSTEEGIVKIRCFAPIAVAATLQQPFGGDTSALLFHHRSRSEHPRDVGQAAIAEYRSAGSDVGR
jgi:hypothetical protein